MNNKNPFNQQEDWEIWFENDPRFRSHRQKSLQQFIKNYSQTREKLSIFMILKTYFLKHTLTASLISILLLGSVSASAAQALAPNEYKPSQLISNLFKANQQSDKDPYTALAPDADNYVANLENCDLALKYPRVVKTEVTRFSKYDIAGTSGYNIDITPDSGNPEMFFSVSCSDKRSDLQWINPERTDPITTNLDSEKLRNNTGWLITQGDLKDITELKYNLNKESMSTISFKYRNKFYEIQSKSQDINKVQLQFNSLVKNSFSDDLLNKAENQGSIVTNCFENVQIQHKSDLYKYNSEGTNTSMIVLTNYEQKKGMGDPKPGSASVTLRCSNINANNDFNNSPSAVESNLDKIPFITDELKKTISPDSVFERKYETDIKKDPQNTAGLTDYIEIYFSDITNDYIIYVEKLSIAKKEFDLKIDLKKTSTPVVKTEPTTTNSFTNEEFEVIGAGQEFKLKRISNGDIYWLLPTIPGAPKEFAQEGSIFGKKFKLSGKYTPMDKNSEFSKDYTITELTNNSINVESNPVANNNATTTNSFSDEKFELTGVAFDIYVLKRLSNNEFYEVKQNVLNITNDSTKEEDLIGKILNLSGKFEKGGSKSNNPNLSMITELTNNSR